MHSGNIHSASNIMHSLCRGQRYQIPQGVKGSEHAEELAYDADESVNHEQVLKGLPVCEQHPLANPKTATNIGITNGPRQCGLWCRSRLAANSQRLCGIWPG